MSTPGTLEMLLASPQGLVGALATEAREKGFAVAAAGKGGVTIKGGWRDAWRANLELRGAGRVIVWVGAFRAFHLAQLDKRARRLPWSDVLRRDVPFRVEAACKASRIYHSGAAAQRVERAIREELGAVPAREAPVTVQVRIEDDLCSIGVDTSGEPLYKRGFKTAVAKAPLRETMAALLLYQCGFDGREPVVDPMCGSGTFVIEAAEIASGLKPGRSRRFAFEKLATFDAAAWEAMRGGGGAVATPLRFQGSDIDPGAVRMSRENAARAGVGEITRFQQLAIEEVAPPEGPAGLVMVNPPYGDRIADKGGLVALYRKLGRTLKERFGGWRVGLVTSEAALAEATGLPFEGQALALSHGGLKIALYRAGRLA